MWATLATAATTLLAAHSSAAVHAAGVHPCRAGPHAGTATCVVGTKKPGLWLASANGDDKAAAHDGTRATARPRSRRTGARSSSSDSSPRPATRRSSRTTCARSGPARSTSAKHHEETADAPVWSADGRWIAFMREDRQGRNDYRFDIALVRPNGKGLHNVHKVSSLTNIPTLAWSRNGACVSVSVGRLRLRGGRDPERHLHRGRQPRPVPCRLSRRRRDVFVPESVAFSADGRLLYVMFPVSVNGKDAATGSTRSRWTAEPADPQIAKNAG